MGKLIRQKQDAVELATRNDGYKYGTCTNLEQVPPTLPDIGVTRKESSTQKQEAGELATQEDGRPISVPDGNTYQTLPDIGVTRKESSTQKQEAGELARQDNNPGSFTGVPQGNTHIETLPDIGVTWKESSTSKNLAAVPDAEFEEEIQKLIQDKKPLTKTAMLRAVAKNKTSVPIEMPDNIYKVIYADPPWQYGDKKEYRPDGAAENHYPTMSIAELCNMEMPQIEDNAVLFLWATSPLLEDSFKVINSWGFKYKTSFVWDKIKHNMGHYNSVRHEFLLVCTKGSCLPENMQLFDSVQSIERTEHSIKPEQFRNIIDTLYPSGNKIELFARVKTEGWDYYGNELLSGTIK